MKKYIKLIRVKHWIKNFLIFVPLFCSLSFSGTSIISTIISFFSFSLGASFIYIINDIRDVDKDRNHPKKKNRPIASGAVKISTAYIIAILILLLSLGLNSLANMSIINNSLWFLLAYLIINIGYSFGLKNVAILDVVLLASGFVIRVYYGAAIINVEVSKWLFLTILNASLFMGFGKRQKEFLVKGEVRKVLESYSKDFVDKFMYICLTLTIVFYSLWAIEQTQKYMFLSIPLLMIVLMEYSLTVEKSDEGDPTTILLSNKGLMATSFIYILFMILIMVVL